MRLFDLLIGALVLLGLAAISVFIQQREETDGAAYAVDGDTLDVAGARVRLAGIDAPELKQECVRDRRSWPCGEVARRVLEESLKGAVSCAGNGRDPYGRIVARCTVGGQDLADHMVREGLAVAYRGRDYAGSEAQAQAARRGIWAGSFQPPAEYRSDHPRTP
ncbi:thermonuclease family protein [Xanthobacter dioxanivorans]|uniref:Thermonuclease family protein n=1 Tax=Xanthobacter dioxanivorans TaxID=2528964 RepID=A0A974PQJ6_9HYPH|nr:thermonuclease family protein [Xanthobacter dioxanivorans]QRG07534.1 thermonuclease family protein [Xanthobacter dioxanivorans]